MFKIKNLWVISVIAGSIFIFGFNAYAFLEAGSANVSTPVIDKKLAPYNEGANTRKINPPEYVRGELIIKLKDGKTLEDIQDINNKYNIGAAEAVFKQPQNPDKVLVELKDKLSKLDSRHDSWYWQMDKDSKEYKDYVAKIEKEKAEIQKQILGREEFIGRLAERQKRAPEGVITPDLGNIFVLGTDKDTDIISMIADYSSNPAVAYAEPNYISSVQMVPNDPYYSSSGAWGQSYGDLWGLKKIIADKAWDKAQGSRSIVAVVDTGVYTTHEDIKNNIWTNTGEIANNGIDDDGNGYIDDVNGWDFVNKDNDPQDGYGHGTHCAGTIAATGNNSTGIIGVAPSAKIMAIKGLSDYGSGSDEDLAKCISYAADNGADIISNSWGGGGSSKVLEDAINYAYSKGCIIVAAAGNDGSDVANAFPAGMNNVIAVAASDQNDQRCYFSNYGDKIEVAAPGGSSGVSGSDVYNILSLAVPGSYLTQNYSEYIVGSKYMRLGGTSMACPHVAGLAALLLEKYPNETNAQIRGRIAVTADPMTTETYYTQGKLGSGRINAYRALTEPAKPYFKVKEVILGELAGDGDQIPEAGEVMKLTVVLNAFGKYSRSVVGVIKSSNSNYVSTIRSVSSFYGSCSSQVKENYNNPFTFKINKITFETPVDLKLSVYADGTVQTLNVRVLLGAKKLPLKINNVHYYERYTTPRIFYYSIYKNKIVYHDFEDVAGRMGSEFYIYDLVSKTTEKIPAITDIDRSRAARFENKLIWYERHDSGSRVSGIYLYDIDKKTEQAISDTANIYMPAIYGKYIVWGDWAKKAICLYDINTKTLKNIKENFEYISYVGYETNMNLAIYNNYVTYTDYNYVYLYDLNTGVEKKIAVNGSIIYSLDIQGNYIVWSLWTGGYGANIYVYDIKNDRTLKITDNSADSDLYALYPRVYGNNVVYADYTGTYLYQINNGKTSKITDQYYHPMIDGSKVIWPNYVGHFSWFDLYITEIPDITAPTGSIRINNGSGYTYSRLVALYLSAQDQESGMGKGAQMSFSNNGKSWSTPQAYSSCKLWFLPYYGWNTVYVKFKDVAGNWSAPYSARILLR